jgi:hypothetical protein
MKKVKIFAGIIWAFAGLIVIIVLFPGLNSLSGSVSRLPFMKIHPRYTGGEVAYQVVEKCCTLNIRKPVFNGFFSDRKSGFVQLDWHGSLPEIINDTIDYDKDGVTDFSVMVDRKNSKTDLIPVSNLVKKIEISTPTSYGWSVRVGLMKEIH